MVIASEKIPAPLTFRAQSPIAAADASVASLRAVVERCGPQQVLAVVLETIGGQASGVNVPDPSFLPRVRELCNDFGIRLVYDEIVTAFRTGEFLVAHHDPAAAPDLVVLAKGLGAGYAPLGAVLASSSLVEEVADTTGFVISHSYDANPLACAAGSAVLDEVVERDLIARALSLGGRLRAGLETLHAESPIIGDVRGRGLLLALELVADRDTNGRFPEAVDPAAILRHHGLDHGLLLYSRRQNRGRYGDWLLVAPPLVVDETSCDELVERLTDTFATATTEVLRAHRDSSS
jgi:adenosylmethionine-8-amino-7-oxononanoate aminotransferase